MKKRKVTKVRASKKYTPIKVIGILLLVYTAIGFIHKAYVDITAGIFSTEVKIVLIPTLVLTCYCFFKLYLFLYFYSSKFKAIKQEISSYITDCNELNDHIKTL